MEITVRIPTPAEVLRSWKWALLGLAALALALSFGQDTGRRAEASGVSVAAVAAGSGHSCARTTASNVWCWGANNFGQLGDGTTTGRLAPVNVPSLIMNAAAVGAGDAYTCALTTKGGVKCWGSNIFGTLGTGGGPDSDTPVDVCASGSGAGCSGGAALTGVAAIAVGSGHACALTTAGGVKCWGRNADGELGDGTTTGRLNPVDVCASGSGAGCSGGAPLTGVIAISAWSGYTCGVTTAGGVKCWGGNGSGQLGDGTSGTNRLNPVDVCTSGSGAGCSGRAALTGVAAVSAGTLHTCALTTGGAVKCWGHNTAGELGDGTTTDRLNPVDVCASGSEAGCVGGAPLTGVAAIAAGFGHTCALTTVGAVKCWGGNGWGQLGAGGGPSSSNPVEVCASGSGAGCAALLGVAAIDAGHGYTCAVTTGGGVVCWGANTNGELGDGTTIDRPNPVDTAPRPNPWFPWDVDGNGIVTLFGDVFSVAQHFNQTKP